MRFYDPFLSNPPVDHKSEDWLLCFFVDGPPQQPANHEVDIHALFDPARTARLTIPEIHDHMENALEYESSIRVGEVIREVQRSYEAGRAGPEIDASALMEELHQIREEASGPLESRATVSGYDAREDAEV